MEETASSGGSGVQEIEMTTPVDTALLVENERWNRAYIYRVPEWLKNMTNREAYQPRVVSLGPFHHGESNFVHMETHKQRALLHIVRRSGKPLAEFITAIEEVTDQLLDAYHDLDEIWRRERRDDFVKMMVTDGCFLLEIMKGLAAREVPNDYTSNDPVFSVHGMIYLWVGIRADMVVAENQLPLLALYRLEEVWRGTTPLSAKEINKLVLNFVRDPLSLKEDKIDEVDIDNLCLHPLDIFHKSFCGSHPAHQGSRTKWVRSTPSAFELRNFGIHFRKNKIQSVHNITFKNGVLHLPAISIHDGTEKIFLNLMAFERLYPKAGSDATNYMVFMDNVIDSERDVALLRSKGIIKNLMSSDKEAAKLFNILSKGAVLSPYSTLQDVRQEVNAHCERSWNKWKAFFVQSYMRNPWVFISLMAAVILLIATLLQAVYTILSFYK